MNREQAVEMIQQGYKITHKNFTDEEYLVGHTTKGIVTEDGYEFSDRFWKDEMFADGWSIVQESW